MLETGVFALGKDMVVLRDQLTPAKSAPTYKQATEGMVKGLEVGLPLTRTPEPEPWPLTLDP